MKKSLLLFFIALISAIIIHAENVLILTKPNSGETDVFRKGSYLVFELKADKSMREGFIRDITDSSLVFDDSQVSLSQINILAGSTKAKIVAGRVASALGNALIITGTTVYDCGLSFFSYGDGGYYYWPIGGSIWLAGAFIAGIGYIFDWATSPLDYSVRVRNYREWNASIVSSPQPSSRGEEANQNKISYPQDSTQTVTPPAPEKSKKEKRKLSEDDVYGE